MFLFWFFPLVVKIFYLFTRSGRTQYLFLYNFTLWRGAPLVCMCVCLRESQRRLGLNRTNSSQRLKSQSWMGNVISLRSSPRRCVGYPACQPRGENAPATVRTVQCGKARCDCMRLVIAHNECLCCWNFYGATFFIHERELATLFRRSLFVVYSRQIQPSRTMCSWNISYDYMVRRESRKNLPIARCLFWIGNLLSSVRAARNDRRCEMGKRSMSGARRWRRLPPRIQICEY